MFVIWGIRIRETNFNISNMIEKCCLMLKQVQVANIKVQCLTGSTYKNCMLW